ncbi:cyclic GMP-AMP synthase-like isoform X2 [Crotalus tigris]|uniref:cyclic GMP-AMP synthase-like isoform X2 n=1 Tax=Crotalus tigris TaxID=88082 RepID=UPI00192F67EC|nr:cyclic GMP-AMP synthase-like isoform X2 [Crotalus tigris]
MEKMLQNENRGRICSKDQEMEGYGCCAPLLPAQMPNDGNWHSPKMSTTSKPDHLEYPHTPVPWPKQRPSRFSHKPIGEGKKLSLTTSTKRSERLAASAAAAVGSGGHQVQQAEDIVKAKKAKTLHPGHSDKVKAVDVVENFIAHFLIYLHECPDRPGFKDTRELIPGDNYAYEQFLRPGEFEVLLTIPLPDCTQYMEVEGYRGLFYTLSLLKKSHDFPATFLLEDGRTISPRNITEEFWKQVNAFIDVAYSVPFPGWQVKLEKKKANSPRVNLVVLDDCGAMFMTMNLVPLLEFTGQGPFAKQARELTEENLVAHLMKRFYFAAEQCPGRHNKETWRISFSHVEKEILYHHSTPPACYRHHGSKCCRNDCLKMLQDLVDSLKMEHPLMLAPLSSHHLQMSFLHTLWKWKADTDWKPSDVAYCFERVLGNFIQEVASAHLSHFFLPTCNLFAAKLFPPTKLKFLCCHLKEKEAIAKTSHQKSYPALAVRSDTTWPHWAALSCSP